MAFLFFGRKPSVSPQLVAQAEQLVAHFTEQLKEYAAKKESKMHRMVELWSLFNLDPELEKEYKNVAEEVSLLAHKIASTEKYVERLRLALYHAKGGTGGRELEEVVALRDSFQQIGEFTTLSV